MAGWLERGDLYGPFQPKPFYDSTNKVTSTSYFLVPSLFQMVVFPCALNNLLMCINKHPHSSIHQSVSPGARLVGGSQGAPSKGKQVESRGCSFTQQGKHHFSRKG